MLICNNNFEKCIAKPFYSWKKIFIKAKHETCCECTKKCQNNKCSCLKSQNDCHEECGCNCLTFKKKKIEYEDDIIEDTME